MVIKMKNRLSNIDLLKVICIFAVILLHVATYNIFEVDYHYLVKKNYNIINFYNTITRFCVPCFIMISGMFLLNKNISFKELFKKYILKIFITYIIFSSLYSLYHYYFNGNNILTTFIAGYYHLWYLYLILGIYLVIPFLKKISSDKKLMQYYLILALTFSSIIPYIAQLIKIPGVKTAISHLNLHLVLGYTGYFVAGYYFSKNKVNNKIFYLLGILGMIINYLTFNGSYIDIDLYDSFFLLPGTAFQSIAIFLFFKNLKLKENYILTYISKLNLGIYLMHVFIMHSISHFFPKFIYNYSIITIPILSIIIYLCCIFIVTTLKSIPIIKKLF